MRCQIVALVVNMRVSSSIKQNELRSECSDCTEKLQFKVVIIRLETTFIVAVKLTESSTNRKRCLRHVGCASSLGVAIPQYVCAMSIS